LLGIIDTMFDEWSVIPFSMRSSETSKFNIQMSDCYLWMQEPHGERHNVWCKWLLWGPYIRNMTICDNHHLANVLP
jgi:hypothetical protein